MSELTQRGKRVYRLVAEDPEPPITSRSGRGLAEQLGYPAELLDGIPAEALASFAGVGYALDIAGLVPGQRVLDLGSGSGTDSFAAAMLVGPTGQITGVDMTEEQLDEGRPAARADAASLRSCSAVGMEDSFRFPPPRSMWLSPTA